MVICAKACRYFTTIILVAVIHSVPQVRCKRIVPDEFILPDPSNQDQTQELVESTEELGDSFITPGISEFQNEADADEYTNYSSPLQGDHGDYSYLQNDSPQPCCCSPAKSKKYIYLIAIGGVILLLFCICACVCYSRGKEFKKTSCSIPSSWSCCDRHAKDTSKTCMINLLGPPPDLSDSETDHLYRMPLPLIYDDKGKICNNAEMFIQRCMTSSIKRTYSEPVKNSISSKPLFEEYLKELANLREKQQRESQKRGAVKAFIKELLQATKKAAGVKKKEKTPRNITDGSATKDDNRNRNFSKRKPKFTRKADKDSSSSISISSVLLKPKYQSRYITSDKQPHAVKEVEQNAIESYTGDRNEHIEYVPLANETNREISTTQIIEDSRNFEGPLDLHTQMDDSEELIRFCVDSLRDTYNKKLKTIFESLNCQNIDKLEALAGTIAKRMALDKSIYGSCMVPGRENNYMDLEKSNTTTASRGLNSAEKLMQEETSEMFDTLMKKLFALVRNRKSLHSCEMFTNDPPILEDFKYATEEEARIKMKEKYLELQKEVERLDKSMRKFALDFVFSESSKQLESSDDTPDFSINTNPSVFESSACCTIINTEGMRD